MELFGAWYDDYMVNIFRSQKTARTLSNRKEEAEFGPGKAGALICPTCGAYYFKKSWHHGAEQFFKENTEVATKQSLCPACKMIKEHLYEGRIVISDVPLQYEEELGNLIHNHSHTSWEKDPMDRLISYKKEGKTFVATTTENQMAQKLARKIKDVFNKVELQISHGKEPSDVVEIKIQFVD
ncbi:MAG: hypothetical protein AAB682_01735 [Patescibacteria group bacterium]